MLHVSAYSRALFYANGRALLDVNEAFTVQAVSLSNMLTTER